MTVVVVSAVLLAVALCGICGQIVRSEALHPVDRWPWARWPWGRCRAVLPPDAYSLHWGRCDLTAGHDTDHALERGLEVWTWRVETTGVRVGERR